MEKNIGCFGIIAALVVIVVIFNFISDYFTEVLIVAGIISFLAIVISFYSSNKKKKNIESTLNEIISQNSIYFDKFNIIAEKKSYKYDEYGDELFDDELFNNELEKLLDKLYPTNLVYAVEIRDKIRKHIIDNFISRLSNRDTISTTDITGTDFENIIAKLFEQKGYIVTLSGKSGDQGADLIMEINGKKIIVQAKYYIGTVGNKAVQEVIAAVGFYDGDEGWVVTNSDFTKSAEELAGKHDIKLINGYQLKKHYNYENYTVPIQNITHTDNSLIDLEKPLLDSATQGYLYDIFIEIKKVKEDSMEDRQHSVHKLPDQSILVTEYQYALLYDISQMSIMLEIDMECESVERNIIISSFAFFTLNYLDYQDFIQRRTNFENILQYFISVMNSPQPYNSDERILGNYFFINYRPIYLLKLKEIVTLITTVDLKLTGKEQNVLDFYKGYINTANKRDID